MALSSMPVPVPVPVVAAAVAAAAAAAAAVDVAALADILECSRLTHRRIHERYVLHFWYAAAALAPAALASAAPAPVVDVQMLCR